MTERVVLPRISDIIEDILTVAGRLKPGEAWEALVLDYRDAFEHMKINQKEDATWEAAHLKASLCVWFSFLGSSRDPICGVDWQL